MEPSQGFEQSSDLQKALSLGQRFMKWIIMGLAFLYFIFGCVLCSVGTAALNGHAAELAGTTLPKGLIAVGVFMLLTALVGIISAWREFRLGLGIYFAFLLLWAIILLSIGIAVLAKKSSAQLLISSGWDKLETPAKVTIEKEWQCCGRYADDSPSTYATDATCNPANRATNAAQQALGCVPALTTSFQKYYQTAGSCGIAFAVLMLIGLAFTLFLMRGIKDRGYAVAVERNRARTQRDKDARRARGKGGLKIPDNVL